MKKQPPAATSDALEAARMSPARSLEAGQGAALRAIGVNSVLGLAKLGGGILGHSYALMADGAESCADIVGSSMTLYGLRVASEPADQQHPVGHGRAETLASALTAMALVLIGISIFWRATLTLGEPRVGPEPWTLFILVPVILTKEWMFKVMRSRGKKIGSLAVVADAWHQRSDAVTSITAFLGIFLSWLGGPNWNHADSWAAMLSSLWLAGTGLWLLGPALHELMEGSADPTLVDYIYQTSLACPGVKGIDKIWVRKLGMQLIVDLHVEVLPEISVQEGHDVAHGVKNKLRQELPQVQDVMVHVEPYDSARVRRLDRLRRGD